MMNLSKSQYGLSYNLEESAFMSFGFSMKNSADLIFISPCVNIKIANNTIKSHMIALAKTAEQNSILPKISISL